MKLYQEEKLAIFIDGSNLYNSMRALSFDLDYQKLINLFSECGRLVRAFYYTAVYDDVEVYNPVKKLIDWLSYNEFTVVTKPLKEFVDSAGRKRIKGNMDIELAIDMMETAQYVDHIVLFSGDGDFRRLVEAVQRKGVRVTVISTIKTSPAMIADDLRRQADSFMDLQDLAPRISRKFDDKSEEVREEEE